MQGLQKHNTPTPSALTSVRAFFEAHGSDELLFSSRGFLWTRLRRSLFRPLQARGALLYGVRAWPRRVRLFLGSSAVEHSTVNRMVAGSNPARGASSIVRGCSFSFANILTSS